MAEEPGTHRRLDVCVLCRLAGASVTRAGNPSADDNTPDQEFAVVPGTATEQGPNGGTGVGSIRGAPTPSLARQRWAGLAHLPRSSVRCCSESPRSPWT